MVEFLVYSATERSSLLAFAIGFGRVRIRQPTTRVRFGRAEPYPTVIGRAEPLVIGVAEPVQDSALSSHHQCRSLGSVLECCHR